MRALSFLAAAGLMLVPLQVQGQAVLWMGPAEPELITALQMELAARDLLLRRADAATGATVLSRGAEARVAAQLAEASAALWIEPGADGGWICSVSPNHDELRSTPVPAAASGPRWMAIAAASLIDEILQASGGPAETSLGRVLTPSRRAPAAVPEETPAGAPSSVGVYFAAGTAWMTMDPEGQFVGPLTSLELGLSLDRTFRFGVRGLIAAPLRPGTSGSAGYGGGLSASLRGAVDVLELRGALDLSALGRSVQNPLHHRFPLTQPDRLAKAGLTGALRFQIGGRIGRSFALLVDVALSVYAYEDDEPFGVGSLGLSSEWF